MKLFVWIKQHTIASILFVILLLLSVAAWLRPTLYSWSPMAIRGRVDSSTQGAAGIESMQLNNDARTFFPVTPEFAPQPDVKNRLVKTESSLSLLITDVTAVRKHILEQVTNSGGYMVSTQMDNPHESPSAVIIVRVPTEKMEAVVSYVKGLAVKTVSEYISGTDVTDQYVDITKRIETLEKTKKRFEAILEEAQEISDITNLNGQIIGIQSQIDQLIGQQKQLEGESKLARLTIYLSTDEIALPYAPTERFRPQVIFKLAVRSLTARVQSIGALLIWFAVYSVLWIPALLIVGFFYKVLTKTPLKKI